MSRSAPSRTGGEAWRDGIKRSVALPDPRSGEQIVLVTPAGPPTAGELLGANARERIGGELFVPKLDRHRPARCALGPARRLPRQSAELAEGQEGNGRIGKDASRERRVQRAFPRAPCPRSGFLGPLRWSRRCSTFTCPGNGALTQPVFVEERSAGLVRLMRGQRRRRVTIPAPDQRWRETAKSRAGPQLRRRPPQSRAQSGQTRHALAGCTGTPRCAGRGSLGAGGRGAFSLPTARRSRSRVRGERQAERHVCR